MTKLVSGGAQLSPEQYGEKPFMRRTKGTPYSPPGTTGFDLQFNQPAPGMDLANQKMAVDVKEIEDLPMVTTPIFR